LVLNGYSTAKDRTYIDIKGKSPKHDTATKDTYADIPFQAPPLPSMALPSPSSSSSVNRHTALTVGMSEDEEDEDDLKYAVSDGDDDELADVPSGKAQALLQNEKACYSGCLLKKGEKRRVSLGTIADSLLCKRCTDLLNVG
jgi:hypothetical protein